MLTIGSNPKLQVKIQSLETTDLHNHTYSGEELLQGFECEIQVYCLNNLEISESQCLKNNSEFPESQCLKSNLDFPECQCLKYKSEFPECQCLEARCLARKVIRNRLFLILRPANVSQAFGPRRKNIDKSVPDINDLLEFPPLGKHLPVDDSYQQVSINTKKRARRAWLDLEASDSPQLASKVQNLPSSMVKYTQFEAQSIFTETNLEFFQGGRSVWDQGNLLVSSFIKYISKQMTYPPFDFILVTNISQSLQESFNARLGALSGSFSPVEIKAERTQTMDSRLCIDPPAHQDVPMNADCPRDLLRRGQDLTKVQDYQSHSEKDNAQTLISYANPSVNIDSAIDRGVDSPTDSLQKGRDLTKVQDYQSHSEKDNAQTLINYANPSVDIDSAIDGGADCPRDSLRRGQDLTKVQDYQSHSEKDDAQTLISYANPSVKVDYSKYERAVMEESLPHASSVSETVPKSIDDKSLYSQSRE